MRILVLGAYGFIGSAIARSLSAGHEVIGVGRNADLGRRTVPHIDWIAADLRRMLVPSDWRPHLAGIDVVVNASGLLQGQPGEVERVQHSAIAALLKAAEEAGLRQFIQISATGAEAEAPTDFMRTKALADEQVRASSIPSVILKPGLVIGRNSYGGTELVRMAGAAPVALRLPFRAPVQCIALPDVVDAVQRVVDEGLCSETPIDLVEQVPHSLDEIIAEHRIWLGLQPPGFQAEVPKILLSFAVIISDLLGRLGWRPPLRTNAVRSLEAGVYGDWTQSAKLLGRAPLSLRQALSAMPAGKQDRIAARMALVLPIVLAVLFLLWFGTAVLTFADPIAAAQPLLERGMSERAGRSIALGGAAVDLILALGLLARKSVRPALIGMVGVTLAYLSSSFFLAPQLWLDPLAPLLKALPAALLALIAYWLTEER